MVIPAHMMLPPSSANRTSLPPKSNGTAGGAYRSLSSAIFIYQDLVQPTGLVELVLFKANVLPGSATMSHVRMTTSRTRTGRRHRGDISLR
jgi:hypothetical protein